MEHFLLFTILLSIIAFVSICLARPPVETNAVGLKGDEQPQEQAEIVEQDRVENRESVQ